MTSNFRATVILSGNYGYIRGDGARLRLDQRRQRKLDSLLRLLRKQGLTPVVENGLYGDERIAIVTVAP